MYSCQHHSSIYEIPIEEWRKLEDPHSPFQDYEFHTSLEDSGVIGGKTGWKPVYLTIRTTEVVAAAVVYVKFHSYGEYIFDWSWAEAAQQAGLNYYPKLLMAIPFTPASARKLLYLDEKWRTVLVDELMKLWRGIGVSSFHGLFLNALEVKAFQGQLLERYSFQYHFINSGYLDFTDYIAQLRTKKAKTLKKERAALNDMKIVQLTGDDLTGKDGEDFYPLYCNTIEDKNSIGYLNASFFKLIVERMKARVLLVKTDIAEALFFYKGEKLYGRYWGTRDEREFLHFELCYYQGIDFTLKNKLKVFEAGAQGEHKIARGFKPTIILSAHGMSHPGLHDAVGRFLIQEKQMVTNTCRVLSESLPFSQK
jgi:predicted N-acyltransferase